MLSRYIDMLVAVGSSNLPREYREETLKALVIEYNRQYIIEVSKPLANIEKEAENYLDEIDKLKERIKNLQNVIERLGGENG